MTPLVTNLIMSNLTADTQRRDSEETCLPNHDAKGHVVQERAPEPEGGKLASTSVPAAPFLTPRLHKKKSSYDLRDEFQHGEKVGRDDHDSASDPAKEKSNQSA